MTNHETSTSAQRPDLGIELVVPDETYKVSPENYPWLSESAEVPTVHIRMQDGTEFRYGSIIGLSHSVEKIASGVPTEASKKAEESLFMALPFLLRGETHPAVDKVMNKSDNSDLLKVGKKGPDAARLLFSIDREKEVPVVLRVATSRHKDQMRLMGIVTDHDSQKRRKRDGGGR
jgi:hypothetical protein